MISETEVKAKEDSELLEIWANQNDYVAEMVAWVKAEIERRNLDTSGIYVPTVEEKREAAEARFKFWYVRWLARGQVVLGLLLVFAAFLLIREEFGAKASIGRRPVDGGFGLATPIAMLAVGVLLIVIAIGVWRGRRWAFTSGVIVHTLLAALSILVMALLLLWTASPFVYRFPTNEGTYVTYVESISSGEVAGGLILGVGATLLNGTLAWVHNALRKRGGMQVSETRYWRP